MSGPTITVLVALLALTAAPEAERVAAARRARLDAVKEKFAKVGVAYPARQILIRAYKREGLLELWAGNGSNAPLALVAVWPVCMPSGALGPKRREGDGQVPEGIYTIDRLNASSQYHMSLHVDYPSQADRFAARRLGIGRLGGDIMVHGGCVTIGCLPIGDGPIEELFLAVLDSHLKPPIHIFPARLDETGLANLLGLGYEDDTKALWKDELAPIFRAFERDKRLPRVHVDPQGHYRLN